MSDINTILAEVVKAKVDEATTSLKAELFEALHIIRNLTDRVRELEDSTTILADRITTTNSAVMNLNQEVKSLAEQIERQESHIDDLRGDFEGHEHDDNDGSEFEEWKERLIQLDEQVQQIGDQIKCLDEDSLDSMIQEKMSNVQINVTWAE